MRTVNFVMWIVSSILFHGSSHNASSLWLSSNLQSNLNFMKQTLWGKVMCTLQQIFVMVLSWRNKKQQPTKLLPVQICKLRLQLRKYQDFPTSTATPRQPRRIKEQERWCFLSARWCFPPRWCFLSAAFCLIAPFCNGYYIVCGKIVGLLWTRL